MSEKCPVCQAKQSDKIPNILRACGVIMWGCGSQEHKGQIKQSDTCYAVQLEKALKDCLRTVEDEGSRIPEIVENNLLLCEGCGSTKHRCDKCPETGHKKCCPDCNHLPYDYDN